MIEEYSSGRPFREFAGGASKQAAGDFRFGSISARSRGGDSPLRVFLSGRCVGTCNLGGIAEFSVPWFFGAGELFLFLWYFSKKQ